ncbi:MAG: NAD(P)/FAD-dependent oxidoreductase [Pseudomonadota bacterium]|nr:NAD(P)/FAD-dependent oxidoreductase [Pseudomonadota bacterium]
MTQTRYLIVGSSHAALETLRAIRQADREGTMAMLTRDAHLPYSPTILPYVVSGRSPASRVILRDEKFFDENACAFVANATATALDANAKTVSLAGGKTWHYEKLLIATGAAPAIPPIPGLENVCFHVLRSLDDAEGLRASLRSARRAVVLGAGLIGLHAAENLAEAGLAVSVVEMQPHVLPGYFDAVASTRIEAAFREHGVALHLAHRAVAVESNGGKACTVRLEDGAGIEADLLLVAVGVKPTVEWLSGSGIALGKGVRVDGTMRTNVPDVWAAGDVAEARDFHTGDPALIGIIPTAVEQGRIAGMDMAGDAYLKPYPGGVPVNTFRFFGRVALSIGQTANGGTEIAEHDAETYRRAVLADGKLIGFSSVDEPFDVGVMGELIRRHIDLSECRESFLARPLETGRRLMSEGWR